MNNNKVIPDYRCFFCATRVFGELMEKLNIPAEDKSIFTREMAMQYSKTWDCYFSPEFSRSLHLMVKKYTGVNDPYKNEKRESNDFILSKYPKLKEKVINSPDPFNKALRLAISGNIMDYGVSNSFNVDQTLQKVLQSDFAIDNSIELKEKIQKANTVLYLGDNCGEIVFDKLFIETIMHPNLYYAVRGDAIINDATLEDARYIQMDEVADIISNGYDAPSTIVDKCSDEFVEIYEKADVIISKGQGNLEGLLERSDKEIFFLLMVKCHVIAEKLGVKKGDFVVMKKNGIK